MVAGNLLRRWRAYFRSANALIPFGFEVVMTILSGRTAFVLLTDQRYFDGKVSYAWVAHTITDHEWKWGVLAMAACLLKAAGLVCLHTRSDRTMEVAYTCREVGWGFSAVLWGCFATSFLVWDHANIIGGCLAAVATLSVGNMLTGPVMPDAPG